MRTFIRVFASLWLTIPILVAIAVILILATTGIGMDLSIGAVRKDWYRAWWFQGLLVLLAANLVACTIKRNPWQVHQWGYLTTHWGVLTIIAGASVSGLFKIYGNMPISKGGSMDFVQLEDLRELEVEWPDSGERATVPIHYSPYEETRPDDVIRAAGATIRITRFLPNVAVLRSNTRPLIQVVLHREGAEELPLEVSSGELQPVAGSPLTLGFAELPEEAVRKLEEEKDLAEGALFVALLTPAGWRYLMRSGDGRQKVGSLSLGEKVRYPFMPMRLEIEVRRHVATPDVEVQRAKPEQNIPLLPALSVELEEGKAVAGGWVLFTDDPEQDRSREFALNGRRVRVRFGPTRYRDLGMIVRLKDARQENHPGSRNAARYESDVEVVDRKTGRSFDVKIGVNTPFTNRGYTFYQSGFSNADPARPKSIFQVLYDPGTRIIYLGAIITVSGTIFMFYLKPLIVKARGEIVKNGDPPPPGPGFFHYIAALPVPVAVIVAHSMRARSPLFAYRFGRAIAATWILVTAALVCYLGLYVL